MKGPYIGSAYYPEDWSEEELPRDIARMKEAGMNVARIGEFAWYKMEPEEGKFDFAWLHRIVDALREAEIAVVMGTPSACPPVWFVEKHPDALKMDANGQRSTHGGRRHCCSNHPAYRFYSLRIAEMLAARGELPDGTRYLCRSTLEAAMLNRTPGMAQGRGLGFYLPWYDGGYTSDLFPKETIGHTGFTGTSITLDPTTGLYVVFLTNRICPSRESLGIYRVRRLLHNAVYTAAERLG